MGGGTNNTLFLHPGVVPSFVLPSFLLTPSAPPLALCKRHPLPPHCCTDKLGCLYLWDSAQTTTTALGSGRCEVSLPVTQASAWHVTWYFDVQQDQGHVALKSLRPCMSVAPSGEQRVGHSGTTVIGHARDCTCSCAVQNSGC